MDIKLSEDQLLVHDKVVNLSKGEKVLLEALAGTGKTTTLCEIIKTLTKAEKFSMLCLAPTHVAKETLWSALEKALTPEQLGKIDVMTTAKASGRFLKKDLESGENQSFRRPGAFDSFIEYDFIAIDEISAVPFKDIRILHDEAWSEKMPPVLYLGDRYQARAVREKQSPVFEDESVIRMTLTKIHRNAGPIAIFSNKCREEVKLPLPEDSADDQIIILEDLDELRQNFLDTIKGLSPEESLQCSWLSYTNKDVKFMSDQARLTLYGEIALEDWQKYEYVRIIGNIDGANNGLIAQIIDKVRDDYNFSDGIKIKANRITLRDASGNFYNAYMPFYSEQQRIQELIVKYQKLGDDAKASGDINTATMWWNERSLLQEAFAEVQSPLAMTVLRSQSRSIPKVWVNVYDINRYASPKKNCLYVAYSRASQQLILPNCRCLTKEKNEAYTKFKALCKNKDIPSMSLKRFKTYQEKANGNEILLAEILRGHIVYWLSKKS